MSPKDRDDLTVALFEAELGVRFPPEPYVPPPAPPAPPAPPPLPVYDWDAHEQRQRDAAEQQKRQADAAAWQRAFNNLFPRQAA